MFATISVETLFEGVLVSAIAMSFLVLMIACFFSDLMRSRHHHS